MMRDNIYDASFSRNLGILSEAEQSALAEATVAIAGLGGIGGNTLIQLARSGVGKFRLADFDRFEHANINRQYGARIDTLGRLKSEIMAEEVRAINPQAEVLTFADGFTPATSQALLEGADLAIDAIDFYSIETHLDFHHDARERGLHILMGSPVGFSACLQVFAPDGMGIEEYCAIKPEMTSLEKQLRYACSIVPELLHLDYFDVSAGSSNTDFLQRKGPSLAVACSLAAALVATEALLILLHRRRPRAVPHTFQFDPYTYRYAKTYIDGGMASYNPSPAIDRIRDRSAFVPQVLELLYQKPRARKAPVNGIELYYKVEGEGEIILMISPLGGDSSFWARQTQELAKYFRVITFDSRGAGESSSCDDGCDTNVLAQDAIGLLEHLEIKSAHVVGLALGGLVAQKVAWQRPNLVNRLVLASCYCKPDDCIREVTSRWRQLAKREGMEALFDACLEHLFSPEYIAESHGELDKLKTFYRLTLVDPQSFCIQSEAGVLHDSSELVEQVRVPTLVVHGQADLLVAPRLGEDLARRLPNSRYICLEHAPHFLTWEFAERFNSEVLGFLGGGGPPVRPPSAEA